MTWPGWGDILPSVTLVATIAALLWAVVRLLIRPVAKQAANEAERRREAEAVEAARRPPVRGFLSTRQVSVLPGRWSGAGGPVALSSYLALFQ